MAAIDGEHNGHKPVGIRYFANMHKHKQFPTRVASCCENHGTHLLGPPSSHLRSLLRQQLQQDGRKIQSTPGRRGPQC
jgi:hypothetical protein